MDENNDIIQKIIYNEPMKKHTSFKIGGNADFFVFVKTIEELKQALFYAKQKRDCPSNYWTIPFDFCIFFVHFIIPRAPLRSTLG